MDDFWPKEYSDLAAEMDRRAVQERTILVTQDGEPVGFIGIARLSPILGTLRGVCFTKDVHGNGTAMRAVRAALQQEFDADVHKIMAWPFADNGRSIAFYKKLGAVEEGLLKGQTLRDGKLTDILLLAFFASEDGYGYRNKEIS